MQITIRTATPTDVSIIHSFISDLEEQIFDLNLFNKIFLQNISNKNNIYLLAENPEGKVIGYTSCHGQLLLHHLGMAYEIQEMFIEENFRGKGVGQQLIGAIESRLRETECKVFEVTTNVKRVATQEFYARCGFNKSHVKFTKEF